MELTEIHVEKRERCGKGNNRKLRRAGKIPAVCYGLGEPATLLQVSDHDIRKILEKRRIASSLFTLKADIQSGFSDKVVMVQEIQKDVFSRKWLHIDFCQIAMDQMITVSVPLRLQGKPKGVEMGGRLNQFIRDLRVKCLPKDIPHDVVFDITSLGIGEILHVSDISLPENVQLAYDSNVPVVSIFSRDKALREAAAQSATGETPSDHTTPTLV